MGRKEDEVLNDWMMVSAARDYLSGWFDYINRHLEAGDEVDEDEQSACGVLMILADAQLRKLGFDVPDSDELEREARRRRERVERQH